MATPASETEDGLGDLIGRDVVIDMESPYVYVGTLIGQDHGHLTLAKADVHDLRDTNTTREVYVLDSKRHGIRANRMQVLVCRDGIVSLSALDDVIE